MTHEWYIVTGHSRLVYARCLEPDCTAELNEEEMTRRLNAADWLYRMGNEDIAAELSASWDLPLHITRGIADWILNDVLQ